MLKPDYIFETSWEVCNKVGGIHTVVSTKVTTLQKTYNQDNLITIGPLFWGEGDSNTEFEEQPNLYKGWVEAADKKGLKVKVGRWNIPGQPIALLVDFNPFVTKKDEIFTKLWKDYKLDSISGNWDYIRPAIFGYVAAMVVESFTSFYLSPKHAVVAHFHEWMTGAGILYLKSHAPHISTVFTTHATTVGRSISGNRIPLYKNLQNFDGDKMAKELGVVSKHSLEKLAATHANSFTTVSETTAVECHQLLEKEVDVVTPNGFENNFVPEQPEFDKKRKYARTHLRKVAETVLGYKLQDNVKFVSTSGRYEFWNKGLDVFIDGLALAQEDKQDKNEVVAFFLIPANNYGPRKDVQQCLQKGTFTDENSDKILTHNLHDPHYDLILNKLRENNLTNNKDSKIKVIFSPIYIDGKDGIFNIDYWDLLIGMDMTVFASYYEPWGYTPLESLAFHVPSITTSLSGFGRWVMSSNIDLSWCTKVVERNDDNYEYVAREIGNTIVTCAKFTDEQSKKARKNAFELSETALWKNLISNYYEAYDIALTRNQSKRTTLAQHEQTEPTLIIDSYKSNQPIWRNLDVKANTSDIFPELEELSKNLWWSWSPEAIEMFKYINEEAWTSTDADPIALLNQVSYDRFVELKSDKKFNELYQTVVKNFKKYMSVKNTEKGRGIAYFSMEFGISNNLKIYSGGLGILAGDYLKQASDSNSDMIGVGLYYKYGYFGQSLSIYGDQEVNYIEQNFSNSSASLITDSEGQPIYIIISLAGRMVKVQVWKVQVGRISLYLLDTDRHDNDDADRGLTAHLYGGDRNYRLQQEILLGIGGVRMLEKLGIEKEVYHLNEGHAAFAGIERIHILMREEKLKFSESLEIVRSSSLFTTHTPVPAGHDAFDEGLVMHYLGHYPERLHISWDEFMDLGRSKAGDKSQKFSMSYLAAHLSQEINGVSKLHGEVTKDMFNPLWEGYYPQESHIGYVTNGVHLSSWTSNSWLKLYEKTFGKNFYEQQSEEEVWKAIYNVDDKLIWEHRNAARADLFQFLKEYLTEKAISSYKVAKELTSINENICSKCLTIGFARRFAAYKRGNLLFKDLDKLNSIVNHPEHPIRFVFAGKAHPSDGIGQGIIKHIVEVSKRPEFIGKIVFVEDYDIELAKKLVRGVDIWLNTPTRPQEASGTSGMKAIMNGVLNFSVLDGWWVEGYKDNAGWALTEKRTFENQAYQDELDLATIFDKLEHEIAPLYYERNSEDIPERWVQFIKKSTAEIVPHFTMKRMLDDYYERFYNKLFARSRQIKENEYRLAMEIADWKQQINRSWENVTAESIKFSESFKTQLELGNTYHGEVVINLNGFNANQIGIELVITEKVSVNQLVKVIPMKLVSHDNEKAIFNFEFMPPIAGNYRYGIRVYPMNDNLAYRQDAACVKWI